MFESQNPTAYQKHSDLIYIFINLLVFILKKLIMKGIGR